MLMDLACASTVPQTEAQLKDGDMSSWAPAVRKFAEMLRGDTNASVHCYTERLGTMVGALCQSMHEQRDMIDDWYMLL